MVNAEQIYKLLDSRFPFSTQEEWDNSGLLINSGATSRTVLCCLDVTRSAVEKAIETGAKIIVSHHPVIFGGLTGIDRNDVVYQIIRNDISVISAHTNFDKYNRGTCYGMAEAAGLTVIRSDYEIGFVAVCKQQTTRDLARRCKAAFGASGYTLGDRPVSKVFICAGSGSGMKDDVLSSDADCFLTGECKYHDMLDLAARGVSVITVGHDLSERISVATLGDIIRRMTDAQVVIHTEEPLVQYVGE